MKNSRWKCGTVICLIILLSSTTIGAVSLKPTISNSKVRTFQQGSLKYVDGIPYLELSGSHYEMGLQYGVLMKEQINESLGLLQNFFNKVLEDETIYLKLFADTYFNMKAEFMEKRIPGIYREELKGIAYGAGIAYKKLLFAAMLPEVTGTGCTTIIKRIDGQMVVARNLDYHPHFLGEKPVIIEYNPQQGNSFVSISMIGFPGVLTGFNEKGIALSLNQIDLLKSEKSRSIPIGYKNRQILESCSTLKDVDKCIQGFRPDMGWLISIASRIDNNGYIYNISSNEIRKNVLGQAEYIFGTNFYSVSEMNKSFLGFFDVTSFYNLGRYNTVKEQIKKNCINSIDKIIDLLGSNYYAGYNDPELGLMHYSINNEGSIQSVVIDCGGEIYFASDSGYSGSAPFYRYNVKSGDIIKYREGNKEKLKQAEKLKEIWSKVVFTPDNEYLRVADFIMSSTGDITIYEVKQLVKFKARDENAVPDAEYEKIINEVSKKYANLPLPQIWKARLILKQGKKEQAIEKLNNILELESLLPGNKVDVYMELAKIYSKSDREKAKFYAEQIKFIVKQFQIGEDEKSFINEVQKIIDGVK